MKAHSMPPTREETLRRTCRLETSVKDETQYKNRTLTSLQSGIQRLQNTLRKDEGPNVLTHLMKRGGKEKGSPTVRDQLAMEKEEIHRMIVTMTMKARDLVADQDGRLHREEGVLLPQRGGEEADPGLRLVPLRRTLAMEETRRRRRAAVVLRADDQTTGSRTSRLAHRMDC
jgi:hypothetical protein